MVHRNPVPAHNLPFQLVIVLRLHHLIALPEKRIGRLVFLFGVCLRVQIGLEDPVQCLRPQVSLAHGREHLDIKRAGMHIAGKLFPDQKDHMLVDHLHIIPLKEKEIPAFIVQRDLLPLVDPVGVDHDIAFPRLAEDLLQLHHRESPAFDQIPQDLAWPHGGQLVHIPHQHQPGPGRYCL